VKLPCRLAPKPVDPAGGCNRQAGTASKPVGLSIISMMQPCFPAQISRIVLSMFWWQPTAYLTLARDSSSRPKDGEQT
jgi:hypothetical protein